jgi:glycerophosphoryl diester phosphodiesterase
MIAMPRSVRILLAVVILLFLVYLALALIARPRASHPFFQAVPDGVLVIAHQGGDGLWPSNTRYAFERAVALGVDVLEMDVHASADGALVVIHDDTVDRTTDGRGAVVELTLAELQALDAGHDWSPERRGESFPYRGLGMAIPTLDELLAAFPDTPMVIEIKPDSEGVAEQLCDALRGRGRTDDTMVGSFHPRALVAFRRACPEVATSAAPDEARNAFVTSFAYLGAVYTPPTEALQVPEYQGSLHVVTERFVRTAHAKNVDVQVWTVNELDDMERLIALGVDGIITDRPDRTLRLLGRPAEVEPVAGVPD